MKVFRVVFSIFCLLIAGAALLNFVATPNDQPLKDISTFTILPIVAYGSLRRNTKAMMAFPVLLLIMTGINIGKSNNISFVVGGVLGMLLPLSAWYLVFRDNKKQKPEGSRIP